MLVWLFHVYPLPRGPEEGVHVGGVMRMAVIVVMTGNSNSSGGISGGVYCSTR